MDGPPVQESVHQLAELVHAVDELRRRVAALEMRSAAGFLNAELPAPAAEPVALPDVSPGLLAALGRFLLGIAGAYLLRAITEAGIMPEFTGTWVGLLYAGGWLVASIRTAASNRVSLAVEGLTASAIAAPLLWEATTRFHAISPWGAAAALGLFISLGQIVAWKHDHVAIGAITALGGAITAVALIAATRDPAPFAIALLIAAAVVEYGAIRDHALAWRWIIALAADFCAFLLVYLTTRPHGLPEGYAPVPILVVTVVQAALLAVYLGSTAVRTLLRRQRIAWFEIGQAAAAVLFVILANRRPGVSAGMIVAAAGCYAAAFMPKARRISRNFHAYATFGLVLLLGGSFILFPGLIAAAWWCILALVATFLGEHRDIDTLSVHGMIYLLAATAGAGWSGDYWLPMLTAALAYYAMLWIGRKRHRIAATVAPAVLAGTTYGFAAAMLSGAQVDRNLASTLETLLISLMALVLGWMAKQWNLTELIWILYPWMAFGAVKLFAQDFGQTRPVTLSLSLLVYGGTLMALPRLLRKTGGARSDLS